MASKYSNQLGDDQSGLLFAHWVLPVDSSPINAGFVRVSDGVIVEVGAVDDLSQEEATAIRRILADKANNNEWLWLTPGLVNAHTHLDLTFDCGAIPIEEGQTMANWLGKVIKLNTSTESLTMEALSSRYNCGLNAMIASGTTCVNDITQRPEVVGLACASGLRGVVSLEFFHPATDKVNLDYLAGRYQEFLSNRAPSNRISVGLSPHTPFNVSPFAWYKAIELCDAIEPLSVIHTHVDESLDETAWVQGRANGIDGLHQAMVGGQFAPEITDSVPLSALDYMRQTACFTHDDKHFVLAHGSYITDDGWAWLEEQANIGVAHCLTSNLWLHQQSLGDEVPLHKLSLGTDSLLSCPSENHTRQLDVRYEGWLVKEHHNWPAKEMLNMLTLQGATQLGLGDLTGSLTIGKHADVVLWKSSVEEDGLDTDESIIHYWLQPCVAPLQSYVSGSLLKPM
jgi:5-methylthioadenosine/S-adenosylhomocysteine deaminase